MRKDRRDNDAEAQGHQRLRPRHAIVGEAQREEARYRNRDDPARGDPGDEQPLLERDAREEQRGHDRQRAHDEEQQKEEDQEAELEILHHVPVERRRQDDEDARHQNDGQILLEALQRAGRIGFAVRHHDAHHGDSDQPGFVHDEVRKHEDRDHGRQQHRRLQIFGHPAARKGPGQQESRRAADQDRQHARRDDVGDDAHAIRIGTAVGDVAVDTDREQRADRIVHNPFPLEHILDARRDVERAEHRRNYGRSRHHHPPAEQRRELERQARAIIGRGSAERPADRHADEDEHAHEERSEELGVVIVADALAEAGVAVEGPDHHDDRQPEGDAADEDGKAALYLLLVRDGEGWGRVRGLEIGGRARGKGRCNLVHVPIPIL